MRITILTCDKYNWILPVFFHFFNKNWKDCPYPVDVITENHLSKNLDNKESTYFILSTLMEHPGAMVLSIISKR